jgi:hypothetical protein
LLDFQAVITEIFRNPAQSSLDNSLNRPRQIPFLMLSNYRTYLLYQQHCLMTLHSETKYLKNVASCTLKKETLTPAYQTVLRHIPEDGSRKPA